MKNLYIGYCDIVYREQRKETVDTALLAQFDPQTLDDDEYRALFEYINGDSSIEGTIINSATIYYIYIGIDFTYRREFFINKKFNDEWSFAVEDVYETYNEAKKAFIKETNESGSNPQRAIIKVML